MKYIPLFIIAALLSGCGGAEKLYFKIASSENEKSVSLNTEDEFSIELNANPTTGYEWRVISIDNDFIIHIRDQYKRTSDAIGGGGFHIFTFKAVKKGSSAIKLSYSRVWESKMPAREITINVNCK